MGEVWSPKREKALWKGKELDVAGRSTSWNQLLQAGAPPGLPEGLHATEEGHCT